MSFSFKNWRHRELIKTKNKFGSRMNLSIYGREVYKIMPMKWNISQPEFLCFHSVSFLISRYQVSKWTMAHRDHLLSRYHLGLWILSRIFSIFVYGFLSRCFLELNMIPLVRPHSRHFHSYQWNRLFYLPHFSLSICRENSVSPSDIT